MDKTTINAERHMMTEINSQRKITYFMRYKNIEKGEKKEIKRKNEPDGG